MEWYLLPFLTCWGCVKYLTFDYRFYLSKTPERSPLALQTGLLANTGVIWEDWVASKLGCSESKTSSHCVLSFFLQKPGVGSRHGQMGRRQPCVYSREAQIQLRLWAQKQEQINDGGKKGFTDRFRFHMSPLVVRFFPLELPEAFFKTWFPW